MSIREYSHGPQRRFDVPIRAVVPSGRRSARRRFLPKLLAALWEAIRPWNRRRRDWQNIAAFNDRMLRDIGVNRASVDRDSSTSFWRLR